MGCLIKSVCTVWRWIREGKLNAIRIGDCAITTIPFEPFSSIGESIKESSPFGLTFVNGYCCGYQGYMPNKNAQSDGYEGASTRFMPGTGEELADALTEMLKEL